MKKVSRIASNAEELLEFWSRESMDGVLAWDEGGRIILFNPAAERSTGYVSGEHVGCLGIEDLFKKDSLAMIKAHLRGLPSGEGNRQKVFECRVVSKSGKEIPVLAAVCPFPSGEGDVPGALCFMRDLSEIKRLRKTIEEMKRESALGRAVKDMAHYIKNILNKLEGGVYMVNIGLKRNKEDILARGWNMVEKNVNQISDLALNLIMFSRQENPKVEKSSPNSIVQEVLELLDGKAREAGVTLDRDLAENIGECFMDSVGLQRCLFSIAGYGIDTCLRSGQKDKNCRVVLRTMKEQEKLRFDVTVSGPDITEDLGPEFLETYLEASDYKGPEFGLLVAQDIAASTGGTITIEKRKKGETIFSLRFPLNLSNRTFPGENTM